MTTSQQLFQINRRINQIKRNLQSRQEKANQWTVPYQKILKNNHGFAQTCQSNFRNSHSQNDKIQDQMVQTFSTKTQRKLFFQRKVKQSRKKINNFHNQLKQLQQLQQKKTKLFVRKENIQNENQRQKQIKKSSSFHNPNKAMTKTFTNSMVFNGFMNKSQSQSKIRTLKDRTNPFVGFKIQKMIQLYQQTKNTGKQNIFNQTLGIGLQTTPYSSLKKQIKKMQSSQCLQADHQNRSDKNKYNFLNINENGNNLSRNVSRRSSSNDLSMSKMNNQFGQLKNRQKQVKYKFNRNLPKVFQTKITDHTNIYLNDMINQNRIPIDKFNLSLTLEQNHLTNNSQIRLKKKNNNIFQTRMKKLLKQTTNFQHYQGNYVQMMKRTKAKTVKGTTLDNIGKVKANRPYKVVFQCV